ncbi:hypothetical protein E3N88_38438 [Mikania micrantha]|uniref:Uncharacterized protein n=1 Tax=Mikania micrantha TaxID=192012 RepID=A0A5N6LTZ5_9ASTR|nr:hypothetical protein E3N88_38438 [Mikania micrantha]
MRALSAPKQPRSSTTAPRTQQPRTSHERGLQIKLWHVTRYESNSRPKTGTCGRAGCVNGNSCTLEDKLRTKCGAVAPNTDVSHYAPSVPYNRIA